MTVVGEVNIEDIEGITGHRKELSPRRYLEESHRTVGEGCRQQVVVRRDGHRFNHGVGLEALGGDAGVGQRHDLQTPVAAGDDHRVGTAVEDDAGDGFSVANAFPIRGLASGLSM